MRGVIRRVTIAWVGVENRKVDEQLAHNVTDAAFAILHDRLPSVHAPNIDVVDHGLEIGD